MPRQTGGPEDGWGILGGGIAALLCAAAAADGVRSLAHAGPPGLLGLGAAGAGVAALGGWGRAGPWPWSKGAPKTLEKETRWATYRDLRRAGWLGRPDSGWPLGTYGALGGIWPVAVRLPHKAATQNLLILAPTGAGKTASVLVPAVLAEAAIREEARRHSLVVIDPKGDVLEAVRLALGATHDILVLNPARSDRSTVQFDLLASIPDDPTHPRYQEECENAAKIYLAATARGDDAGIAAHSTADPYWLKQPANILKALIMYKRAVTPGATLLDVMDYLIDATPEEMVADLTSRAQLSAQQLRAIGMRELQYNERARGTIYSELIERFALVADPRVGQVLGRGTLPMFDVDAFLARPTALVLQVGALGNSLLPLLSLPVAAIQQQLVHRATHGGPLPRGVRFIIDEGGAIGRLHGLAEAVATLRSYDVGHLLVVQTLDQLRVNYGEAAANIIVANMVHRLALGGTADEDGRWFCAHLGKKKRYNAVPGQSGDTASLHYTPEEWDLLKSEDLRRMQFEAACDSSHLPPLRLRLRSYSRKGKRP